MGSGGISKKAGEGCPESGQNGNYEKIVNMYKDKIAKLY